MTTLKRVQPVVGWNMLLSFVNKTGGSAKLADKSRVPSESALNPPMAIPLLTNKKGLHWCFRSELSAFSPVLNQRFSGPQGQGAVSFQNGNV